MPAIRWTALVAVILTYGLIVLGALVRATNSGLSCPDWPTCYGHWVPLPGEIPAEAGYAYYQVMLEWLHRLIAGTLLGPLVLAIALLAWLARRQDRRLPLLGGLLLLLLLSQASLGAITVLDQNSPWSVALHLGNALLVLAMLLLIWQRAGARPASSPPPWLGPLALLCWLLALAAMLSAAMTAKSGASLACATWPLCDGALVPPLDDPLVAVHFAHRALAGATALVALLLYLCARRAGRTWRQPAAAALVLVVCQVTLGALVILLEVPVPVAVLHQAVGVLTFIAITLLMWRCMGAGTGRAQPSDQSLLGASHA